MKISNVYQALWYYSNCRPSDSVSVSCAWPDPDYPLNYSKVFNPKSTISDRDCFWLTLDLIIRKMKRVDRKHLMRTLQDAKHYEHWWYYWRFCENRPPKYILRRFKRKLKNVGIWK
jgi:hypothetical protein